MTEYWQPTAASYLGRVSKDLIAEAVRGGLSDQDAPRLIAGLQKQAMAERAEQLLAGKGWLPPLLRPADIAALGCGEAWSLFGGRAGIGDLSSLPFSPQGGARRQNRTVPAYNLPPHYGKALRGFDRFGRGHSFGRP